MPISRIIIIIICVGFLIQAGCDHGIEPKPVPPYGISGTIHFSHWPPMDSVRDLRVVAFQHYPSENIIQDILLGKARYNDSTLSYGVDSLRYTLLLSPLPAGVYQYIVVAQNYGPNLFTDWRVVGQFETFIGGRHPASIFIPGNEVVHHIDINVDFQDLPPQPELTP